MAIINTPGGGGASVAGSSVLIYSYTVSGSTKASIDTNVDGANAGLFATTRNLLEVWIVAQTAKAANTDTIAIIFNNDTGANYDYSGIQNSAGTVTGFISNAQANILETVSGASLTPPSPYRITIPAYAATTFQKVFELTGGLAPQSSTGETVNIASGTWRNTAAITRIKVTGSGGNLAIGSCLYVYAR